MTETQLYLAIGVPTLAVILGIFINGFSLQQISARMGSIEARLPSVETRLDMSHLESNGV